MKDITQFLLEKLKINKNSKIKKGDIPELTDNPVINKILYGWGLGTDEPDALEAIEKWVDDNNIDEIRLAADLETLNETDMPDIIRKLYDSSATLNEECQYRLNAAKEIYSFGKMSQIYAAPDLIAFIGPTGTLYAIPEYTL